MRRALLVLLLSPAVLGADTYPRQAGIDAVHYVFRLGLSDTFGDEYATRATGEGGPLT